MISGASLPESSPKWYCFRFHVGSSNMQVYFGVRNVINVSVTLVGFHSHDHTRYFRPVARLRLSFLTYKYNVALHQGQAQLASLTYELLIWIRLYESCLLSHTCKSFSPIEHHSSYPGAQNGRGYHWTRL